jgi:hypothetical protein
MALKSRPPSLCFKRIGTTRLYHYTNQYYGFGERIDFIPVDSQVTIARGHLEKENIL